MKRIGLILVLTWLLAGCAAPGSFEVIGDVYAPVEVPKPAQMVITLPKEAAFATLASDNGSLYFCDGYEIAVETLPSGNIEQTFLEITGYRAEDLTCFVTEDGQCERYECVWTSVGEGSSQIGRAVILDDGTYHYCVSVMADALDAGALQESWRELFGSIVLR